MVVSAQGTPPVAHYLTFLALSLMELDDGGFQSEPEIILIQDNNDEIPEEEHDENNESFGNKVGNEIEKDCDNGNGNDDEVISSTM